MPVVGRVFVAGCGVAVLTAACLAIRGINATTVGFAYLLLVLALAASWGLVEAVFAAVAAMLCYNYFFLPPVGRFTISDSENWIALVAFLITALVASHLSDRAKQQAAEARQRQLETEQLYALSRAILLSAGTEAIGPRAAQQISQIFGASGVVLYDAQSGTAFQGGPVELTGLEDRLKQAVLQGAGATQGGVAIWPISLGGHSIGALALQELRASDGAVQALLNLVAIAIERVRTETAANRADAARQSEEFKSTLLDAVAHEFKTPLTSIKAASTALLSGPQTPETAELLSVIDEETDRLNSLVTEAVRMSQIDAGKIRLERTAIRVPDLFEAAVESFGSRAEGRIQTRDAGSADPIFADRNVTMLALRQLIENALKYTPPSTPVTIWADRKDGLVVIHVADEGRGIPERDRERIFDKFSRLSSNGPAKVPGSGLGLHIAREIARMHGGDLWVDDAKSGGAEFCLALPRLKEAAA